jgi:hypothetical protein
MGWFIVVSVLLTLIVYAWVVWDGRGVESQRRQVNGKLSQASWTSSAMQDSMDSGE